VDATFAFFTNLTAAAYWAQTDSPAGRKAASYRGQMEYAGDRYGLQLEQLGIARASTRRWDSFGVTTSALVRTDAVQSAPGRCRSRGAQVRRDRHGRVPREQRRRSPGRDWRGEFAVELQNSDRVFVNYGGTYELIPLPVRFSACRLRPAAISTTPRAPASRSANSG
jgi:hypothetical protein